MAEMRQLKLGWLVGLWAGLCFLAALYGAWTGLSGPRYVVVLCVFALLLAGQLLFAARGMQERAVESIRYRWQAFVAGLLPFLVYLAYALATESFTWQRTVVCVIYSMAPVLVLASAGRSKPGGAWQDYVAALLLWVPVEFRWLNGLWPYPDGRYAHVLTALLAINVGVIAFLVVRQFEGMGYNIGWGRRWALTVGGSYAIFAAIAIVLGIAIQFIRYEPSPDRLKTLPVLVLTTWLFTAWPEEFLFRGVLQNALSRTLSNETIGWLAASVVFGLSHINNLGFPNWRYVLLATIAGLFYGYTWRATRSLFASSIVHTLVNVTWHALFRTL